MMFPPLFPLELFSLSWVLNIEMALTLFPFTQIHTTYNHTTHFMNILTYNLSFY